MRVKQSTRWIQDFNPACRKEFEVPYIDKGGKVSIFSLTRWYCHPMQLVGSLISTKFSRIMCILRKRYPWWKAKTFREDLFSAVAVSTITQSDWILDRFLGVSKSYKKKKILRSLVLGSVRRLDDIQRFVYSQVWKQAHWLTSRSERPRDKSNGTKLGGPPVDLFFVDPKVECQCESSYCFYGSIFTRYYCSPNKKEGYQSDAQSEYSDW